MITIFTTLLNGFWRFVRRFLRSEQPLYDPKKHQHPIIPINNTIRMMLQKTLSHMMMLSWKLQFATMRTIPWKGSMRISPCGLESLLNVHTFWQKPSPIPKIKNSRNNYKPFIGYFSTSTPLYGFKNLCIQKNISLLTSVLLQGLILHVQTLEPSRNLYFWRQEVIWTQKN